MKASELNNSTWESATDAYMVISKHGRGYIGYSALRTIEAKNAKEMLAKLKEMGFKHIGYHAIDDLFNEENNAMFAAEVELNTEINEQDSVQAAILEQTYKTSEVEEETVQEAPEAVETIIVERAMSEKNPTVKKYLEDGWVFIGKVWNSERNMYLATLERGNVTF